MKKFLTLVCMITCIFGLTACGSEDVLTDYEQQKADYAQQLVAEQIIPVLVQYADDAAAADFDGRTAEEVQYLVGNQLGLNVDGYGFVSAISSFNSAIDTMGAITGTGATSATIDGNQIIVEVEVTGELKDAKAEVILTNDMFMILESAALNPVSTMSDLMVKAALNTVIGMGTVFAVLIMISGIISCFSIIPKLQASMAKKNSVEETISVEKAAAPQVAVQETVVDETDDLELIAVIAAAIAASEGAVSTDGFVVRSIRRRAY